MSQRMVMASALGPVTRSFEPRCILCGSPGNVLYENLADRLFGAKGSWSLKKCVDQRCGLIWQDPMPAADELAKAYANYYTHTERRSGQASALKEFCKRAETSYVQRKFGYAANGTNLLGRCLGSLLHTYRSEGCTTFLESVRNGKLLDVGCGSGAYLASMRALGWEVEGLEIDPAAVKVARQSGLKVQCGTLTEGVYEPDSLDAVTMCHVIEHVNDPIRTIKACARILKPGGKLVLFTPNAASLGHRLFKEAWRGLEPPRHLFLFWAGSMRRLLNQGGFQDVSIRPQVGSSVVYDSYLLWRGAKGPFTSRRNVPARVFARVFSLLEMAMQRWNPTVTDCLAAIAIKQ